MQRACHRSFSGAGTERRRWGRSGSVPGIRTQEQDDAAVAARTAEVDVRLDNVAIQIAVAEFVFNRLAGAVHFGVEGGASVAGLRRDHLESVTVRMDFLKGWSNRHGNDSNDYTGCQEVKNGVHANASCLRKQIESLG